MLAVFARVEPAPRKSVTFDNDTAFAQHALLRTMRADDVGYLSHKYVGWRPPNLAELEVAKRNQVSRRKPP